MNAFVTNATAESTAHLCAEFLNDKYTEQQILALRKKYSLKNLFLKKFNPQELLIAIENQAVFLIDMFQENRINNYFREKELDAKIEDKPKDQIHFKILRDRFNRRIYHLDKNCSYMQMDFEERGVYHLNTGLFAKELINEKYYVLEEKFLRELGMTQCQKCEEPETIVDVPVERNRGVNANKQEEEVVKIINDCHPDIKKFFNKGNVISYKAECGCLILKLDTGITIQIFPLVDRIDEKGKHFKRNTYKVINKKKEIILNLTV